jgi:hypothetical protein
MQTRIKRYACVLPLACLLAACGKGLDRKLDTAGNDDAFNASYWAANKDMSEADNAAWSWAVQDLSINNIRAKYPDATLREVIRGEAKDVLTNYPPRIKELEASEKPYDEKWQQLQAITASNVSFSLSRSSDHVVPRIDLDVHNGSPFPVSRLQWHAELYIDGGTEPVADDIAIDEYKAGLPPSATLHRQFSYGNLNGIGWDTQEIQNAKTTRVVVTVKPSTVEDFSDHEYMAGAPYAEINQLRGAVESATKYASY